MSDSSIKLEERTYRVLPPGVSVDMGAMTLKGNVMLSCGDLGINNKTPNRMLTRRLPHTKCINASPRIRFHASIRLIIRKKEK